MSVDNRLTSDLMVLVNNAEKRMQTYWRLARQSVAKAKDHPLYPDTFNEKEAAENTLADALKERFDWMTEDINLLSTKEFPKDLDRGPKGREDDPHEERKVMIQCLAFYAYGRINWLEMARRILADIEESEKLLTDLGVEF